MADAALHKDRGYNANTHFIITQHIEWAALLPSGHLEMREILGFAVDVLVAFKATSKIVTRDSYRVEFKEPLKGRNF
ncbi:hypothetical protein HYALB_00011167 [Hymenoscyphus albidus]|uniref:Uncharacterized protein n=1 Tax=Hymenoscyphus albidus TaxID=595503 RepID=A0A9N9PTY9_9HELO|nr:hypothetical protein HYALB_00011167 [Hymenoscyphus albidus]